MSYLSKTTILGSVSLFLVGIILGAASYVERSPVVEEQVPGSNAIPAHVVLAVIAVGLVFALPRHRLAKRAPYSIWVAPFSRSGLDRFTRTVSLRSGASPIRIAQALLAVVLSILLMFNFLRAGMQIIGGLDPNFTVNAWGGPSYLGALLAHYLDGACLFYVEAFLLNLALDEGTR
jgi:hypothetical protein